MVEAEGQWVEGERVMIWAVERLRSLNSSDEETASELQEEAQILRLLQKQIGRK